MPSASRPIIPPGANDRLGNRSVEIYGWDTGNEHIDVVDADQVVLDQDLATLRNKDRLIGLVLQNLGSPDVLCLDTSLSFGCRNRSRHSV